MPGRISATEWAIDQTECASPGTDNRRLGRCHKLKPGFHDPPPVTPAEADTDRSLVRQNPAERCLKQRTSASVLELDDAMAVRMSNVDFGGYVARIHDQLAVRHNP